MNFYQYILHSVVNDYDSAFQDGMSVCIRKKKKRNSSEETDGLNALINGEQVDEDAVKGDFDILLHGK